ncbi:MAG TPA: NAD(P)-binding domain-containing protein [Ktedonobacteraceae bacterium]
MSIESGHLKPSIGFTGMGHMGSHMAQRLLDVLGQTTVLAPGQKSKLENVKREQCPTNFALSLMHKDFSLGAGSACY